MAIDPENIELSPEQRRQIAECASRTGQPWSKVLSEALRSYRPRKETSDLISDRSFYDAMKEENAIGIVKDQLPHDLSTNPKHMEGFGLEHETNSV